MGFGDSRASPTMLFPLYSKPPCAREDKWANASPSRSEPAAADAGANKVKGFKAPLFGAPSGQDKGQLGALTGARSDTSSIRDTQSLFDLSDLVEDPGSLADVTSIGSPTHSAASDGGTSNLFSRLEEFKGGRPSFEEQRAQKSTAGQPLSCFERKTFLPKGQMSLTPVLAPGSCSPQGTLGSPSAAYAHAQGASSANAYTPWNTSPARSSTQQSSAPQQPSTAEYGRPPAGAAGPVPNAPGLRERVLLRRASSNQSGQGVAMGQDMEDLLRFEGVFAECLNFEDVETISQDRELEKDAVDGISIVTLPCHIRIPNAPEYVLYALHFASNPTLPVLAGDDSTKMLFPPHLQATATKAAPPSQKPGRS